MQALKSNLHHDIGVVLLVVLEDRGVTSRDVQLASLTGSARRRANQRVLSRSDPVQRNGEPPIVPKQHAGLGGRKALWKESWASLGSGFGDLCKMPRYWNGKTEREIAGG